MKTLLFLCTGNYYRSRFAEFYFRHLARRFDLPWEADSRGLALFDGNEGPLSAHTMAECKRLGISTEPSRFPIDLEAGDLAAAERTIAVKESEHRPLMRERFPDWERRIEYWKVHDLDLALPAVALPELQRHVESLVATLRLAVGS